MTETVYIQSTVTRQQLRIQRSSSRPVVDAGELTLIRHSVQLLTSVQAAFERHSPWPLVVKQSTTPIMLIQSAASTDSRVEVL